MFRRLITRTIVPALTVAGLICPLARADDPRVAADFLRGLREREYFDLALEYLPILRSDPTTPPELKVLLDYEEARCLIGEASRSSDLESARRTLDKAKSKIDGFVKANPDLPQTTEALVELAHLLYERGRIITRLAEEQRTPADKDARLNEARSTLSAARDAYEAAYAKLNDRFNEFPKFIADGDPKRIDRERVQTSLMQSELQKSVVDYEIGQTYPAGSPERKQSLDKGLAGFEELYKKYRTQLVGFTARMWQGKTYEERGELGPAMGIYNELIDHPDPRLRVLQKQVDYFRIIVMGKRGEHAKAADEARRWLNLFPKDRRSFEALGVQLELAKAILAQLPELSEEDQKQRATKVAGDYLIDVVRYYSPHKPEAVALLRKVRPNRVLPATELANMSYDEAMAQADSSSTLLEFERSISLLKAAIRKADPNRDAAKANKARFKLAYVSYLGKRYYDSAIVAEHLARRYPSAEDSSQAAEIGMAALVDAYNNEPGGDRAADLDRLVDLARYTADTWPGTDPGDSARIALGKIALGRGKYADAIAAFDALPATSGRKPEALASSGDAHWKLGQTLRGSNPKEADAEVAKAIELLNSALQARRGDKAPDSDPDLVNITCDLAIIQLETNKPAEGLKLVEPLVKSLASITRTPPQGAAYVRVLTTMLRGHVATNQVDKAVVDMKTLEETGIAGASGAQLYFKLGELLEREIETLRKKDDARALARTQKAYEQFLTALVGSKEGQSFESLRWAGENLLKLDNFKQADEVFTRILDIYGKDPEFLKRPQAAAMLLRVKLKQAAAMAGEAKFAEADKLLDEIARDNPRSVEPQMEIGYVLDRKAEAKKATWAQAHDHWRKLALKLAASRQKPPEYYEAWYRSAVALEKQGKKDLAQQSLASVVRLSNFAGAADMKAKYLETIKRLGK